MPRILLRDREVFEWIETTLVPRLIDTQPDADMRVWCIDCPATEDAYALAMLLRDAATQRRKGRSIRVFASCCSAPARDAAAFAQARDGFYTEDVVRNVAAPWRRRLFVRDRARYRVHRDVRKLVTFSAHELFDDPPLQGLDLIVYGKLLSTLADDERRDVLELFHYTLGAHGLLLLGRNEPLAHADLFVCENASLALFRRRAVPLRQLTLPRFAALPAARVPRNRGSKDSGATEATTQPRPPPVGRRTGTSTRTRKPFAGYRVLIVDDNADAVEALGMLVGMLGGSDIRMALDGREALDVAADFRPDVVLLDLSLPQLSGFDVAARIRSEPWGRNVLLVAVTGWGRDQDKARTKAAGFDHHLTKPADSSALEAVLRSRGKLRDSG